jgi:hypothetical protein
MVCFFMANVVMKFAGFEKVFYEGSVTIFQKGITIDGASL